MVQGEPKKFSLNEGPNKKGAGNTDLTQMLKSGLARGSPENTFDSPDALMEDIILRNAKPSSESRGVTELKNPNDLTI